MGMLTEEEKRELLAMARSVSIRDEFRSVRASSRPPRETTAAVDELIGFLNAMSRFAPATPRKFVPYRRVLL